MRPDETLFLFGNVIVGRWWFIFSLFYILDNVYLKIILNLFVQSVIAKIILFTKYFLLNTLSISWTYFKVSNLSSNLTVYGMIQIWQCFDTPLRRHRKLKIRDLLDFLALPRWRRKLHNSTIDYSWCQSSI